MNKEDQSVYLLTMACIAVANQCYKNIRGVPLFHKTIFRAAFVAQSYDLKLIGDPSDLPSVLWTENNFLYFTHLHNQVIQGLDINIEVPYPIEFLAKAIPQDHPSKEDFLNQLRSILVEGEIDNWAVRIENSLVYHPKEIAFGLYDLNVYEFNDWIAKKDAQIDCIE